MNPSKADMRDADSYRECEARVEELERENAALRKDKEQLARYLEELLRLYCRSLRETGELSPENSITFEPFYAAIDAARKEQP